MNKYMELAIQEARMGISKNDGGPFGCVIVKDGKVIGQGHNEVVFQNDATCHGEMMALRKAMKEMKSFDLSGCDLYTTGEPCPMCMGAILWANISHVYYGCNIKDTEEIGFRDKVFYEFDKNKMVTELDRKECLDLYEEYKNLSVKTNY